MFNLIISDDYLKTDELEKFVEQMKNGAPINLQTSGSTGAPKHFTYPSNLIKRSALKTNTFFGFNEKTVALLCMSTDAIAGKMMVARALVGNFTIHVMNPSKRPLELVKNKIDFVAMVPLQLRESLLHDLEKLKSIETIVIGGGPISFDLEKMLRSNNITVYHSFGMTETVSHIALRKVGRATEDSFQALNGIHFSTFKDQLIVYAEDLGVDGLLTNDLVHLLSPTSFQWMGRKDFVINSGGIKMHPEILENKWSELLATPFFLWKEESEKWGEEMVLFIEGKVLPKVAKTELLLTFKSHEIPKSYYLCEAFIYTASGKIDRRRTTELKSNYLHEATL